MPGLNRGEIRSILGCYNALLPFGVFVLIQRETRADLRTRERDLIFPGPGRSLDKFQRLALSNFGCGSRGLVSKGEQLKKGLRRNDKSQKRNHGDAPRHLPKYQKEPKANGLRGHGPRAELRQAPLLPPSKKSRRPEGR